MSLIDELFEKSDKKIVKSFTPKSSLCDKIFNLEKTPSLKDEIRDKLLQITNEFWLFAKAKTTNNSGLLPHSKPMRYLLPCFTSSSTKCFC